MSIVGFAACALCVVELFRMVLATIRWTSQKADAPQHRSPKLAMEPHHQEAKVTHCEYSYCLLFFNVTPLFFFSRTGLDPYFIKTKGVLLQTVVSLAMPNRL